MTNIEVQELLQAFRQYAHDEFGESVSDYMIQDFLKKARPKQKLNIHGVSVKRPFIIELLKEFYTNNRISPDETADKILAACASGAVDTVAARGVEMCGSDCCPDNGRCEHCQNPITDVRKSSEGQP